VPDRDGKKMAKCMYCDKEYVCSNYSTGNMWKHIKKAHPEKMGVQKLGSGSSGAVLTPAVVREALVKCIVKGDQPFITVDDPEFREFACVLNPTAKVPSNDTVRRDIARRGGR
jgi:hypothetical protein